MNTWHKNLTQEKWNRYPLREQMLMIGSEFSRILHLKDHESKLRCLECAFELIDLTVNDKKLGAGRSELLRLREILGEEYIGQIDRHKIEQCYKYCFDFAGLHI